MVQRTILLLALALALTSEARADDTRAQAKAHFDAGEQHYAAKEFREAITAYTKAHDLLPNPAFIYNIAQCHRGLGEHEQAIAHYERYLHEAGNPEDRELVEQLIAEERAALAPKAPPPPEPAQPEEAPVLPPAPAIVEHRDPPPIAIAPPPEEPEVYEAWWFWTAVAVAATAIAGGTAIAVASSGSADPTELPSGSAGTLDWRSP